MWGIWGSQCADLRAKDECESKKSGDVMKKSEESSFGRYELCDDERVATGGEIRASGACRFAALRRGCRWRCVAILSSRGRPGRLDESTVGTIQRAGPVLIPRDDQ